MISAPSSEQRYRTLFDRYHREVYAYCRRRTDAQTAADCAAETFLVAWRRFDDIPDGDASLGWLYGVARRTLANEFRGTRRRRRLHKDLRGVELDSDPSPEVLVVRRERDEQIIAALERLRPRDREVLRLALWEELPHAEIADLLGCSTQAVTQRVYRATRRVTKEFQRLERPRPQVSVSHEPRGGETR